MPSQATIQILADTSRFDNGLERDLERILQRVEQRLPPITVHAQLDRRDEERIQAQLRGVADGNTPDIELHVRLSQADVNQVRADLMRLTSLRIPDIVIPARLDDDDFQRGITRIRTTNIPDLTVRVNGPDTRIPLKRVADLVAGIATLGPIAVSASVTLIAAFAGIGEAVFTAGIAVAAFAAAVVPQMKEVTEVTKLYDDAQKAAAEGSKDAAKKQQEYERALKNLQPATRDTAKSFIGLRSDFKKWSDSLSGTTMPVFTKALELLRSLLPQLTPLVKTASTQFGKLIDGMQKGVDNGGFSKFIDAVSTSAKTTLPLMIRSIKNLIKGIIGIGAAFGPVSDGVGKSFEQMTKSFATWGQGLKDNKEFQSFLAQFADSGPALSETLGNLAQIFVNLLQAMAPFSGVALQIAVALSAIVAALPPEVLTALAYGFTTYALAVRAYAVATAVATAATFLFSTANGASNVQLLILRLQLLGLTIATTAQAVATGIVTAATWAWGVAMAVVTSPITLVIAAIALLVAAIYLIATRTKFFQTVWSATWGAVKTAFFASINAIKTAFFASINAIKTAWGATLNWIVSKSKAIWASVRSIWNAALSGIKNGFTNTINAIKNTFSLVMSSIRSAASTVWSAIRSTITGRIRDAYNGLRDTLGKIKTSMSELKDKIVGYFRGAGRWLYNAGQSIIKGLISGMGSMVGRAVDKMKGIVSKVRDLLPFSPAKTGPFSGKGYTTYSGKALIEGFMQGIEKASPGLQQTMSKALEALPMGSPQMAMAGAQSATHDFSSLQAPVQNYRPVVNATVMVGNEALDSRMVRIVQDNNNDRDRREFQGMRF